ncbi:MAG TPA: hypothetical protein VHE78_01465 [Gemmatimonadaceae bacterium]|nr:hypothetical protein [Gemmatimonadaceae bacterium]
MGSHARFPAAAGIIWNSAETYRIREGGDGALEALGGVAFTTFVEIGSSPVGG